MNKIDESLLPTMDDCSLKQALEWILYKQKPLSCDYDNLLRDKVDYNKEDNKEIETAKKLLLTLLVTNQLPIKLELSKNTDLRDNLLANLQTKYSQSKNKYEKLLDLYLSGSITQYMYDEKQLKIKQEEEIIKHQLNNIDMSEEQFVMSMEYMMDLIHRLPELFKSSKTEQKREIINLVFSNLEIEDKKLRYSIRKPFNHLLQQPKGQIWLLVDEQVRTRWAPNFESFTGSGLNNYRLNK